MGIVVNDAIVLLDRVNYNLARGMDIDTAIFETAASRLQPILLTTITTIVGLMSIATQDAFFAGLAYTIMFGLFVGSAATLFMIPMLYKYVIFDKTLNFIKISFWLVMFFPYGIRLLIKKLIFRHQWEWGVNIS